MDFLQSLIEVRETKEDYDIAGTLSKALQELTKFDKLAKNDKFKEFQDNEQVQRFLPLLTKLSKSNPLDQEIMSIAIDIYQTMSFENNLPETVFEKSRLHDFFKNQNFIYQQQEQILSVDNYQLSLVEENEFFQRIGIIEIIGDHIVFSHTTVNKTALKAKIENQKVIVLDGEHQYNGFTIKALSLQGNNDFEFARYKLSEDITIYCSIKQGTNRLRLRLENKEHNQRDLTCELPNHFYSIGEPHQMFDVIESVILENQKRIVNSFKKEPMSLLDLHDITYKPSDKKEPINILGEDVFL